MVSSKFIKTSKNGYIQSTHSNKHIGGAVPLLLNKIIRDPIKGGSLSAMNESGKSNRMVGIISTPSISTGGDLLRTMENLRFNKKSKPRQNENIRFIV